MDKYAVMASEIYKAVGGSENIKSYTNCMTRLRIDIVDRSKINDDIVKKINGVLGIVDEGSYQVILGPGVVTKVAKEFGLILAANPNQVATSAEDLQAKGADIKATLKQKNNTPFKNLLQEVGAIFIPLIPAFIGAGLIAGIAGIITNSMTAGNLSGENWAQTLLILNVIKNGIFSYLAIYVGINAAKEFGATPSLGGAIGGVTLLMGTAAPDLVINNIFTDKPLMAGQGGIIGVLLAVWLLSVLEKQLRKVIPDALDIIITPFISLLVIGLSTIFLIMPFAGFVSEHLLSFINWVLDAGGLFSGFVLGSLFLPLVMLGLHQILMPIHLEMISSAAGATTILPILAMAGAGQVGAVIAVWLRCKKNKSLTKMIKSALPVGILGIGEPLIYGVTVPLGRPFITACIGGGIGGAVIGAFGKVGAVAVGPSGAALIPLIANNNWLKYLIGLLAAYIAGFIITYFFGVPRDAMVEKE